MKLRSLSIILAILLATAALFIACDYASPSVESEDFTDEAAITAAPVTPDRKAEAEADTAPSVTVIFSGGPDARGYMQSETVEIGLYRVPDCLMTCDKASFGGWFSSLDGLVYQAGDLLPLTDPHTPLVLTAVWTAPEYEVKVTEGLEDAETNSVYSIKENSAFSLLTPAAVEGYRFSCWVEESTETAYRPGDTVIITHDTTFRANYERIECVVRFHANGGNGTMSSMTVAYGDSIELPACAFTREFHYFNGWSMPNGSLEASGSSVYVRSDLDIYASWHLHTTATWQHSEVVSYSARYTVSVSNQLDIEALLNSGYQYYRIKLIQLTVPCEGRCLPGVDVYSARPQNPDLFEMDKYEAASYGKAHRVIDSDEAVSGGLQFNVQATIYSNKLSLSELLNTGSTIYIHEKARAAYPGDVAKNTMEVRLTLVIEVW